MPAKESFLIFLNGRKANKMFNSAKRLVSDIWNDRRLMGSLSVKDFQRKFSGTYFGMVWAIAQPLLTILVYWFAFQYGFHSSDVEGTPYVVWFMCGIVPWLFVTEAVSSASNSFIEYNYLIKKVKFNVSILPCVKILSAFYIHLFFCVFTLLIAWGFHVTPTLYLLQLPYYMVANFAILFVLTVLTSSVVVFFRDMNQIISVILLMGMWGTPIAWNLMDFSAKVHPIFKANPFYYIIEGYRDAVIGRKWFWETPRLTLYFWIIVILLMFISSTIYYKLKPHFADTV